MLDSGGWKMTGVKRMINVGIIGFGYMGHYHYRKAIESGKAEVIAICDVNEDRLEEGKELGFRCYRDVDIDKFLLENIDLVVIATQNQFHEMYAVKALEAGKNVMCEKPVTLTVAELDHITETAQRTGKIFTVHQQRRFDRDFQIVEEVVHSGQIGRVHTIESRIMGERGVCFDWRADPEAGGGMLYDWGVHLIDQLLILFPGETVQSVQARLCSILTPAVDDYFELKLQFSNEIYAKIMVCTFALEKLPRWFVFGDRGTLKLDDMGGHSGGLGRIRKEVKGFDSVVGKKGLGPSRTMAPLEPGYLEKLPMPEKDELPMHYWENLIMALEGKSEPYVKLYELRRQMLIVEAAFESARMESIIKTNI